MKSVKAISTIIAIGFGVMLLASPLTIHVLENDVIKVEVNDYEYGYDQIWYLKGAADWVDNLYHMSIAFWNGSQLYEYNTTTLPLGHTKLVEVQEWVVSGADPNRSAHVILGDHATTPSFTIDLTIKMEGYGKKSVRSDYVISKTSGYPNLTNAKLYLYGDPRLNGTNGSDSSAYYAARDLFYVYDTAGTPDLYFGFNQPTADQTRIPMHYYGHHWSGAYGTEPMRSYMVVGANYPDIVTAALGDQMGGWNWDLGTVSSSVHFTLYMGLGTSVADLAGQVTPIFLDGFESGGIALW